MSKTDSDGNDPEIDRINLRIARSFLDVVDETWRERDSTAGVSLSVMHSATP